MAEQKKIQIFDDPDLVVLRNAVAKIRFHLSVYQTKFLLEVLSHLKAKPDARTLTFNIREFNKSFRNSKWTIFLFSQIQLVCFKRTLFYQFIYVAEVLSTISDYTNGL